MKIVVTGASGLLGSEIVAALEAERERLRIDSVLKQRCRPAVGFIAVDFTNPEGWKQLAQYDWDVMIHTAALRDPDTCAVETERARQLNAVVPAQLAQEAARRRAVMIHISTDYVFSGKNPPYNEGSPTGPINYYGETKLRGEGAVMEASESNCVLRVPFLYGLQAGIEQSPMLSGSISCLLNPAVQKIDDYGIRYPTYTGDVARAVILLLKQRAKGIFHCSGMDKITKYGIVKLLAELLELDSGHIVPDSQPSGSIAARPHDSHLSTDKLSSMGWEAPLPLSARLQRLRPELLAFIDRMQQR